MHTTAGSWAAMACLVAVISGCSSTRHFWNSNIFASQHLELRRDGKFEYASVSDEIGSECFAQGQWHNERRGGVKYIVLEVERYGNSTQGNCERVRFKQYGLWLASRGGILQVTGDFIERKARPQVSDKLFEFYGVSPP